MGDFLLIVAAALGLTGAAASFVKGVRIPMDVNANQGTGANVYLSQPGTVERTVETTWLPLIDQTESKYHIPHGMLHALINQESHFRPDIVNGRTISSAGAVGIAQIVPRWHPNVDALNPAAAIPYAGKYLAQLYAEFGSWKLALAAYNYGPGNVDSVGRDINSMPQETQAYVAGIMSSTAGLA